MNGEALAGAVLDLWQTDGEGLYEEQRRTSEPWMRGIYHSQADGSYTGKFLRDVLPAARAGRPRPNGRSGRAG